MIKTEKKPQFGEIWLANRDYEVPVSETQTQIKSVEDTRFVLVLSKSDEYEEKYLRSVYVSPISFDVDFASHLDLILSADENPLKVECMAEFWNIIPALECNLERYEGRVTNEELLKGIKGLWKLAFGLADESTDFSGIITGSFIKTAHPRVRIFQEQEIKETEFLRTPTLASLSLLEENEAIEIPADEPIISKIGNEIIEVAHEIKNKILGLFYPTTGLTPSMAFDAVWELPDPAYLTKQGQEFVLYTDQETDFTISIKIRPPMGLIYVRGKEAINVMKVVIHVGLMVYELKLLPNVNPSEMIYLIPTEALKDWRTSTVILNLQRKNVMLTLQITN
ncbi:MAG: hypothetical protein ABSD46_03000 [Bacteroidota bacterium]